VGREVLTKQLEWLLYTVLALTKGLEDHVEDVVELLLEVRQVPVAFAADDESLIEPLW